MIRKNGKVSLSCNQRKNEWKYQQDWTNSGFNNTTGKFLNSSYYLGKPQKNVFFSGPATKAENGFWQKNILTFFGLREPYLDVKNMFYFRLGTK